MIRRYVIAVSVGVLLAGCLPVSSPTSPALLPAPESCSPESECPPPPECSPESECLPPPPPECSPESECLPPPPCSPESECLLESDR